MISHKVCSACKESLELSAFYRSLNKCKKCWNVYKREWLKKNPEKSKAYCARFNKKNPKARHDYYIKKRNQNPLHLWNKALQTVFGITANQWEELNRRQNNLCAICNQPEIRKLPNGKTKRLSVDHDHKTNVVRGLLCDNCNVLLGRAKDSVEILRAAISYLQNHANLLTSKVAI